MAVVSGNKRVIVSRGIPLNERNEQDIAIYKEVTGESGLLVARERR
jgi:hypothetical protein